MKIDENDYINHLKQTADDIRNFGDEIMSRPGDIEDVDPNPLINSIQESLEKLMEYESLTGNRVHLDSGLTKELYDRIDQAIQNLSLKIANVEFRQKKADALMLAMGALRQFQDDLRNVSDRFDNENFKIKRKEPPNPSSSA